MSRLQRKKKKVKPGYIPKSYGEFITLWDQRIEIAIRKYRLSEEQYEDLKQDIYEEFIRRDYFKIYDPRKGGTFSTFVYSFVNTRALRFACKMTSIKQKFMSNFDTDAPDGDIGEASEQASIDVKSVDYLTADRSVFWNNSLDVVRKTLGNPKRVRGFLFKDGKIIERSIWGIFELLKAGVPKEKIAEELNYSVEMVSKMILEMRTIPDLIRWRETYHDIANDLIKSRSGVPSLGF